MQYSIISPNQNFLYCVRNNQNLSKLFGFSISSHSSLFFLSMEDKNDPDFIVDLLSKLESFSNSEKPNLASSESPAVPDPDSSPREDDSSWKNRNLDAFSMQNSSEPTGVKKFDGRSMLGFSLTSPDLVICAGSPDIPIETYGSSPDILGKTRDSIEISLENGIDESNTKDTHKIPSVKFSTVCQTFQKEMTPESSFELFPQPPTKKDIEEDNLPAISINAELEEAAGSPEIRRKTEVEEGSLERDTDRGEVQEEYECQKEEVEQLRKAVVKLRRENQLKNKECQEAWKSLKDLQNELMRKSMHVGSLAFAIEGQVKEKSRWFSSLRDMTRKLKIMKIEHIKLSEEASELKNCLGDIKNMSETILHRISQQGNINEELKNKFLRGAKERKELYNKILELKGNIRVFCRCRPLNTEETAEGASMAVDFELAKDGELIVMSNGAPKKTFKFDSVFGPQANQADVFEDTVPLATSVLDGYNVCIFAYGQTGTGKTFTMEGTEESRGVNYRTLEELFRIIDERKKLHRYEISVSVLEVYNEQIRDLLSGTQGGLPAKSKLEVKQSGEGMHHVPGLSQAHVNNMSDVWDVLQTGSNARAVGSTNANEHSSRSHCIHCVMVKGENLLTGECTKSKLWLVDLAGSERIAKTEVQGERLKETQNINRSLSALGDVISALATKSPHIPFRNSKLTHLLQDSLGGDSKTLMFVQISPNESDVSETLCSLNFASRVRGIELGPAKRQLENPEFLRCKQMVEKSKQEMKIKDLQIKMLEDRIHGLDWKMKERDSKHRNLQDKVRELEAQLLIERKLARQHVDTKIAEQHQQMEHHQEVQNNTPMIAPLTSRPLGTIKNINEATSDKGQVFPGRPLPENISKISYTPLHSTVTFVKRIDPSEKENNPDMAENLLLPKRTGRASIGIAARGVIPVTSAPRRNSLIPLPSSTQTPVPLLQVPLFETSIKEEEEGSRFFPENTLCNSPKVMKKSGGKKSGSSLRRSLLKKNQMKGVPMQQQLRRGVNVGMEKVRVSIGSRGRMVHKVLPLSNGRRGAKENQQKLNFKEKERGWNIGTAGGSAI